MLALRLPPEIERRLDALAKKTGRSKSWFAREAVLRQIEDIEDTYPARHRKRCSGPRISLESLERGFAQRVRRQNPLLELVGKLEWDESYDTKVERGRR